MNKFRRFASGVTNAAGSPWAFVLALLSVVGWASLGPHYHWSDSHSLFINTATTVITYLMVFLIQNAQNRDARALHLKIDELIRAVEGARNSLIGLEKRDDE